VSAVGVYLIVRDGQYTYLPNNLGAYEILEITVGGSELTLRFLDTWHQVAFGGEDIDLRPDSYTYANCEGGLLVDCDERVLMVFTRHRSWSVRAAYFDTVRRTWPGWQVRWAYDGIGELARYVGLDPAQSARADRGPRPLYPDGRDPTAESVYLVTVAAAGGQPAVYGPTWNATPPWWVGPSVLDALGKVDLDPSFRDTPRAGMHLDPAARTAAVWTISAPLDGLVTDWPRLWPGWRLEFWEDQIQQHLQRCGEATLSVPVPDAGQCALELADCVVGTWLFFLAGDVERNYRETEGDQWRIDLRRQDPWKLTRERTAMTHTEMADLLQAITGQRYHRPRWPDTMDTIRAALR
jgi:hypothetical protein